MFTEMTKTQFKLKNEMCALIDFAFLTITRVREITGTNF